MTRIEKFLLILICLSLVTCTSPRPTTDSESLAGGRTPAQAEQSSLQTAQLLTKEATSASKTLPELGDMKAFIFKAFTSLAQRELSEGEPKNPRTAFEKAQRVLALFKVFQVLSEDSYVKSFSGVNQSTRSSLEKIKTLAAQLEKQIAAEKVAKINEYDMQYFGMSACLSYLRIISNGVTASLKSMIDRRIPFKNPGSPVPASMKKARDQFIPEMAEQNDRLWIALQEWKKIANDVATYPMQLAKNDFSGVIARFSKMKSSDAWKAALRISQSHFQVRQSDDIENIRPYDYEYLSFIALGPKLMNHIFHQTFGTNTAPRKPQSVVAFDFGDPRVITVNEDLPKASKRSPAQAQPVPTAQLGFSILVGNIPAEYLGKDEDRTYLGYIEIDLRSRLIKDVKALTPAQLDTLLKSNPGKVLVLKRAGATNYDTIYPGFIDLHDHTQYNHLQVWTDLQNPGRAAAGQFENRFEWRDWVPYKKAVSKNVNPWKEWGKSVDCALFRWAELQAMAQGTTYLQGPSSCVENFGINRVEDKSAFLTQKDPVQAPTDLVDPDAMTFVWTVLKPLVQTGKTYEQALADTVAKFCPALASSVTAANVNDSTQKDMGLNVLKDQAKLVAACKDLPNEPMHPKFIRYLYWVHPTIAGKKKYLDKPTKSGVVVHLAEGRRDDYYNQIEYEIVRIMGFHLSKDGKPRNLNFVHGVGISPSRYAEMKNAGIGLVWSPFSNLLLYAQTLDIEKVVASGVLVSLGTDWEPTGSKGVLEEVKLAKQFVVREKIEKTVTDKVLYKMMTEYPAKMIGHWDIQPGVEAAVGRIAPGAMATIVVVSTLNQNPYTNIVDHVTEKDVNFVFVDGRPLYGNVEYLKQIGVGENYESLSNLDSVLVKDQFQSSPPTAEDPNAIPNKLKELASSIKGKVIQKASSNEFSCGFTAANEKGLIHQNTGVPEAQIEGLNLDRYQDIRRLIFALQMTQSLNVTDKTQGDPEFAVTSLPSLYSCNDQLFTSRFNGYVRANKQDELARNENKPFRDSMKQLGGLTTTEKRTSTPDSLKQNYPGL